MAFDYASQNHQSFIGRSVADLPTPALVISLPIVKRNIAAVHKDVEALGIGFRPHIKTLKCKEITRMMLGEGKYRGIIASTLAEIRSMLPLVEEGILDECVYGLPIYPSVLPRIAELRQSLRIILIVDNEQQVSILEKALADGTDTAPWDIFIKIDVGTGRAGIAAGSPAMESLIQRAEASSAVRVKGIYCHAGHSYGGRSQSDAEAIFRTEVESVFSAAKLLPADREVTVSVGATPTAHVVSSLQAQAPANVKLELHAGNFPCHDLQQLSTGVITEADLAVRVVAEVCGVYPQRNEALVNAGVVAISRETSAFKGFGQVLDKSGWSVARLSQEHGILGTENESEKVDAAFKIGDRVFIRPNHTCITAAAFHAFFVVDETDTIVQTWVPAKGW